MPDICIIGGGASGMVAAISAARENPEARICILEKKEKLGKKLLATGNGRCNLTNRACGEKNAVLDFFHGIGVVTREEDQGRIYPYSGQAADVLRVLEMNLNACKVEIRTDFTVDELSICDDGHFHIMGGSRKLESQNVLIATGGKAAPQFGCSGDGYRLAKQLGHRVSKTFPVLTPLECQGDFTKLKGVRVKAVASLFKNETFIAKEEGEVQFTEYGLSGICIFNLSRFVSVNDKAGFSAYRIVLDFMPKIQEENLVQRLKDRPVILHERFLVTLVPEPLAQFILKNIGKNAAQHYSEIAAALKRFTVMLSAAKGWQFAQCTSGGIPADEINRDTMESCLVQGLFFAGEIIDYDGPCGGYNLHHAWESGIKAGRAMAKNV